MEKITVGSVCSGVEAASVAWRDMPFDFKWFSEISTFPAELLAKKYHKTVNLGDMCALPDALRAGQIPAPDLVCGGTPCQAFSLAGLKKGLGDDRGNLTLKYVDIINACDEVRSLSGQQPTMALWENVEGVLRDKTNAFGCFLGYLAGYHEELKTDGRWPQSGIIRGPTRNVAWRVLDAKYFGLAQQRRRLYVLAGGKDFSPEDVLFEHETKLPRLKASGPCDLRFEKKGQGIEVFRRYTDCLYSAYGTKWNGNAAAYNGSLYVAQGGRIRRLTPLECERLMGFPDGYTDIEGASSTSRYQAVGNSWAIPVIKWIGTRINELGVSRKSKTVDLLPFDCLLRDEGELRLWSIGANPVHLSDGSFLNPAEYPSKQEYGDIRKVIDVSADEKYYITPVGCRGILRRKQERALGMNARLELILRKVSSAWSDEEIEIVSRRQPRGRFSSKKSEPAKDQQGDLPLFG